MSLSTRFCFKRTRVWLAALICSCGLAHIGLCHLTQSAHASNASIRPFIPSSVGSTNINIIEANDGGQDFQVGQQIDTVLSVSNQETTKPVTSAHPVTVIDMLPKGLASLSSSGVLWQLALSASSSPATLTAIYNGPYPLAAGIVLPPIIVSGIFTMAAIPTLTSNVLLEMSDEINFLYIISTYVVRVAALASSVHSAATELRTTQPVHPAVYPVSLSDAIFHRKLLHLES